MFVYFLGNIHFNNTVEYVGKVCMYVCTVCKYMYMFRSEVNINSS